MQADRGSHRPFPRGALVAAAALVGLALVLAADRAAHRRSARMQMPAAAAGRQPRAALRGPGRRRGRRATRRRTAGWCDVLAPGTNGFIRGVLRGLARERRQDESAPSRRSA